MRAGVALVAGATGCVMSACSGSTPARVTAGPPGSPAALSSGLHPERGVAYLIGLPDAPAYLELPRRERPAGVVERQWRHELTPGGASCTIVAIEQGGYRGNFPQVVLLSFDLLSKGDRIVKNARVGPPAGASAAVEQESTFAITGTSAAGTQAHLYQRQVVTRGRTLVSITAAAPESAAATCRSADIVASLQLTGQDAPSPKATPSAS